MEKGVNWLPSWRHHKQMLSSEKGGKDPAVCADVRSKDPFPDTGACTPCRQTAALWSREQALNYIRQAMGKRNGSPHPVHWPSLSSQDLPKVQSDDMWLRVEKPILVCGFIVETLHLRQVLRVPAEGKEIWIFLKRICRSHTLKLRAPMLGNWECWGQTNPPPFQDLSALAQYSFKPSPEDRSYLSKRPPEVQGSVQDVEDVDGESHVWNLGECKPGQILIASFPCHPVLLDKILSHKCSPLMHGEEPCLEEQPGLWS